MAIETKQPAKKTAKKSKEKYIVRPGFHVLIQDGQNRQTFAPGDSCELTSSQFKKVAHQVEEWSEDTAKRIAAQLEADADED